MAGDTTQVLARFAATLDHNAIPDRVREYCKTILLDTLACALAASRQLVTSKSTATTPLVGRLSSAKSGNRRLTSSVRPGLWPTSRKQASSSSSRATTLKIASGEAR